MSILERTATFSSSQIYRLMTNDKKGWLGAPALKYIKQVKNEIELGRSINKEVSSRPCDWGNINERRAFDLLPLNYELISKYRLFHTEIEHYSGMPDLLKINTCADIKSPYSLEVFCDKIEALQNIETYKKEFPEDYWQHISSAILLESNGINIENFEAIIYCPFKEEIKEIKEISLTYFDNKYNWILNANEKELPYIIEGKKHKNLNIFSFPIIKEDKILLTERIKYCVSLLKKDILC